MRIVSYLPLCLCLIACQEQEKPVADAYPITAVPLNQVELTDSFWRPRIETLQRSAIQYAFDKCEEEGRYENFITAGKVMKGEQGTTRGKMPFDDTDVYKTIEGAAYSLITSPDPALDKYVDSVIDIIKQGQEPDGYLTTWRTINPMQPPCTWVQPGERWTHLGMSHELYNAGHLYEAAAAHYMATGKRNLLDIALKNADLVVDVFGQPDNYDVPGHQIIETGLVKLYQITGKEKYLALSKKLLDLRGEASVREPRGPYSQDHVPVTEQDEVVGHAVRAVYMYAGMTDIAAIYKDAAYRKAVDNLWENMVNKKMYITGGIGARHEGEAFGDNYELPNLTAYSETCAAIGSVYWNDRLFRFTGDAKYYDIVERTLYNGLIAGISLGCTEYFYPNPLEADAEYGFNIGTCTRQPWFDCSCCPSNLIRFIPYIPNLVYATENDKLYVNLYISNKATIDLQGKQVKLGQTTGYPWDGKIAIEVTPQTEQVFTLKARIPGWARNEVAPGNLYTYQNEPAGQPTVTVNGEAVAGNLSSGYIDINRTWKNGDLVVIDIPMGVREVKANQLVENLNGKTSVEYGPLVYCLEEADNKVNFEKVTLTPSGTYTVENQPDLLGGVTTIHTDNNATLIPYYAWSNRGINKMKVWMDEK